MSDDVVTFHHDITPSKVVRGETALLLATAEAVRALLEMHITPTVEMPDLRPVLRDLEAELRRMRA